LILTRDAELGKKFDKAVFPGNQGGPLEHVIAAKAVAFGEALKPDFKIYSGQVIANAQALATQLQARGFKIVSGGTDNHLMLVDLRSINMTGKRADQLMSEVNVTTNKNTVPFDPESPFVTSGLRLGSPAMTTRGLGTTEFIEIANIIADRLLNPDDAAIASACRQRVAQLCERFPLYPHLRVPVPALV
jgi:glycine hydroxymethyltransferase